MSFDLKAYKREWQRKWRAENPDKERALKKRSYAKNKDSIIEAHKKWRHANPEKAKANWARGKKRKQEKLAGRPKPKACEICGNDSRKIHFDHCHQSGQFRGWLCFNCNAILGLAADNPTTLQNLAEYLEKRNALGISSAA